MALQPKKKTKATVAQQQVKSGEIVAEDVKEEVVEFPHEEIKPAAAPRQLCEVRFDASYTHNLGNYSSVKFGVSLMIPCQHAEIDKAYDYAETWVDARMTKLREGLA